MQEVKKNKKVVVLFAVCLKFVDDTGKQKWNNLLSFTFTLKTPVVL